MNLLVLNIVLALAWGAVTTSFHLINLTFGFALGALAIWLLRDKWGDAKYFRRVGLLISLLLLFVVELWKSATTVVGQVMRPVMRIEPGIVAVPLTVDRDFEITLLANLITLTPGTLTVDVSTDRSTLYVHALNVGDTAQFIESIKQGFERKILETFR